MRCRALIVTLALMLFGIALASSPERLNTLTCSATSSFVVSCFIERPLATIGQLEFGVGIDARLPLTAPESLSIAPYFVLGYYAPTHAIWAEIAAPDVFPPIGRSDVLRVGFSFRF